MKQYSANLRERLLGAIDAGLCQAAAARLYGVGISATKRWRARRQQTGTVQALSRPGRIRCFATNANAALVAQARIATMPWSET